MNSNKIANPFVIGKYVSEDYFCDRSDETAFLKKQVDNGRNTAIIAPRRLGKTGLIHHLNSFTCLGKPSIRNSSLYTHDGPKGSSLPSNRCDLVSSWMLLRVNPFSTLD